MPRVVQPIYPSAASDGYAPPPRSALSRFTVLAWKHRARRSSSHPHTNSSFIHHLPAARASLSSHYDAYVHRTATFCGGLSRRRSGKFEQVRACVCWAHRGRFLGQRTSREGARSWRGEWHGAIQETFQVGACVPRMSLQEFSTDPFVSAPLALLRIAPLTLTLPFALTAYLFVAHTLGAPDQALVAALFAGAVTALVGLFCVGLVSDT